MGLLLYKDVVILCLLSNSSREPSIVASSLWIIDTLEFMRSILFLGIFRLTIFIGSLMKEVIHSPKRLNRVNKVACFPKNILRRD